MTTMDAAEGKKARVGECKREGKDPEVEEALNLWFSAVLAIGK